MEEQSTPGPVIILIVGLVIAAAGWLVGSNAADSSTSSLGEGLVTLGEGVVGLSILAEFFIIGSTLRRIAGLLSRPARQPGASGQPAEDPPGGSPKLPAGYMDVPEHSPDS